MSKPTAEEIIDEHGGKIYALALRLTGNPSDAEDVTQDALIKVIKAWDRFRGESNPATWMYRITVNTWKNRVRYEKRRSFWKTISLDMGDDEDEGKPFEPAADDPSPDAELEKDENKRLLNEALGHLDPGERAILTMREIQELSYQEIAETLEVPIGTVKSRIARAREALAERLKPMFEDGRISNDAT